MELEEFKDRSGQEGSYKPNRRRIKIVNQTADEIIADIEFADNATESGTPINAEKMNKIRTAVINAENNSSQALTTANNAKSVADQADTKSTSALTNSQNAVNTANIANQTASEALSHIVNMQGTKVKVSGNIVSEFDADTKVDVTTFNNEITNLKNSKVDISSYNTDKSALTSRVTTLEAKPLITKVTYDAQSDTFIF